MPAIKRIRIYAVVVIALFLELTIAHRIRIFGARPDLMLMPVIFFALYCGAGTGAETGLIAGTLRGIFSCGSFGVEALTMGAAGFSAGILGRAFTRESRMTRFLIVFSLTAFSLLLRFTIESLFSKQISVTPAEYALESVAPVSLYTALLSVPVFSKLIDWYGLREPEEDL